MNVTNTTVSPDITINSKCNNYRKEWPTTDYLLQNAPPEYYPMLGMGAVLALVVSWFLRDEVLGKHKRFLTEAYFKLSARVILILTAYWVFVFAGM